MEYFNVIGIHRRTRNEIIIEPHMTEPQAFKMCEQWGWFYDDGTDDGSYVMEIRKENYTKEDK